MSVMSKKIKSGNALKHGLYSQQVILPGEKPRDYALLCARLREEWAPEGPTEEELVDRLAAQLWKRRRLHLRGEAIMQARIDSIETRNRASNVRRYLKELAPEFAAAQNAKEVESVLNRHKQYRETITDWIPRSQEEAKWGPAIADHLAKLRMSEPIYGPAKIPEVVDVLDYELERKIDDRFDEAIDRTIKRLIQVKTSKAVFSSLYKPARPSPKVIDVTAPDVSPNNDNGGISGSERRLDLPDMVEKVSKRNSESDA
jgi:hypothetical protein